MNTSFHSCVAVLCGLFFSAITYSQSIVQTSAPSEEWPIAIQREHKPGVIWWIPGSALTNRDTSYNLEQLSEAGFGGMSMVPIYGVHGAEDRFLEHLSPEWNREFAFVLREANRLGLWLDLTPGTGWKIGGPTVELDMGEQSIRLANGQLESRFNRAKVKRAAPGGAGLSIDPYSIHALNKFLSSFYERLTLPAGLAPRAYYHDSFEYGGNWTSELPYVFQRQHGYDLRNNAAELFNQGLDPERNARVQFDYRETLDSLHYQFVEALRSAAHEHGSQLREQAHGSPANILDLYALADIPETEVFGANRFGVRGLRREEGFVRRENDHAPLVNRLASSAAHIGGGKLVSSESFTWLREHFNTALSDIKPEIDSLFVTGVNHIFYHGNCYSPQDGQWPGWLFYASTEVNSRNAFWRDISVLNTYIARCQSILQSGEADNDVLLYWPLADVYQQATREPHIFLRVHNHEQWLTATACGELADHFSHTGVQFDFVSDRFLQNIQIVDGKLVLGNSIYKAIVVPPCQYMSTDSLARLSDLATAGAVVCFCAPGPSDVPGLGHLETRRREFQAVKLKLETDGLASSVDVEHVGQWLAQHGIENESLVGSGLQLIRRRVDQGVYYFVTNLSDQDFSSWAVVSRPFVEALRLDPMLGRIGRIENRPSQKEVFLQLASGESTILFLSNQQRNEVGEWVTWEADGREISIEGPWQVEFIAGGPNLPSNFETEELGSWTSSSASAESFAGTARYRCTFELTDACWASKLKLGDVRETARVFLDETLVQTLVANPFECQIPNLSAGKHSLEIEVTNLSANRIRDLDLRKIEWKKFYDINYVNLDYKPFDASAWPIRPSGLLGPVTLQPLRALTQ
ncbi:MAG: hypothetical protein KDB03_03210 [Planctomycetales bacterium]|nr:hypothetical protein [Planctomycetales bacterium]